MPLEWLRASHILDVALQILLTVANPIPSLITALYMLSKAKIPLLKDEKKS